MNIKSNILDGKRLLVIEDNADAADLMCQYLRLNGSRTIWVDSLERAIRRLCIYQFDAIILDLTLPDADAAAAVSIITRKYPEIPIVVSTGSMERELESIREGAQEFVLKGSEVSELTRAIGRAIERHKVRPLYMPAFRMLDDFSEKLAAFERALEQGSAGPLSEIMS